MSFASAIGRLSRRQFNMLGFAACIAALCFAMFVQYGLKMTPCHLCIFQRVEVLLLGIVFLLAALHNPGTTGARIYSLLILLAAVILGVTAGRHVWIQMQPPGTVPGCGADLAFMLNVFPLMEVIIKVFKAGGECAKIDFSLFGISFPGWVLAFAVVVGVAGVVGNWKLEKK